MINDKFISERNLLFFQISSFSQVGLSWSSSFRSIPVIINFSLPCVPICVPSSLLCTFGWVYSNVKFQGSQYDVWLFSLHYYSSTTQQSARHVVVTQHSSVKLTNLTSCPYWEFSVCSVIVSCSALEKNCSEIFPFQFIYIYNTYTYMYTHTHTYIKAWNVLSAIQKLLMIS